MSTDDSLATTHDNPPSAAPSARQMQREWRALFNESPNGIVVVDAAGRLVRSNPQMSVMFGYSAAELAGLSVDMLLPERFRGAHPGHRAAFAAHPQVRPMGLGLELARLRKDGAEFPLEIALSPLQTDGELQVLAVVRDVTDIAARRQADAALLASEERFRRMVETAGEGIWLTGADGQTEFANQRLADLLGYASPAELLGGVAAEHLHPDDQANLAWIVQQRREGFKGQSEMRFRRKDGSDLWALVSANYDFDAEGNSLRIWSMLTDITDRKVAETALEALNQHLEQRVHDRTAALEEANLELEAFAYSVSHDLRAPLRAISGFSQIVNEEYGPLLPAEGQRYLQQVRHAAGHMGVLIDDLLNFSRLNRWKLTMQPVDLSALAAEVWTALRAEWQDRTVDFTIGDLAPCEGDVSLLRQVFVNLLSNALKFTAKQQKAVISVTCTEVDGNPACRIQDNGAGFDMRYVGKLFGVFQRLHRQEEYPGTGVGLAIVQRIVQRHGGRVWAESELGKGATFFFTVPKGR